MPRDVVVKWKVQPTPHPEGTKPPHHFRIGLGLVEKDVSVLDNMETRFTDVPDGDIGGYGVPCAEDGTELTAPKQFRVLVEPLPDNSVMVPVIVEIGGEVV